MAANPEVYYPSPTEFDFLSSLGAEPPLLTEAPTLNPGQMDLLLDGYVSHTLTPLSAEKYMKLFIKCLEKKSDASLVARDTDWVVICSKTAQLVHQLQHLHQQQQPRAKQKRTVGYRNWSKPLPPLPQSPMQPCLIKHHEHDSHPHRSCEETFDHVVDLYRGTIVPQLTWVGVTEATGVVCPVFFTQRDGTLGVPYAQRGAARDLLLEPMALAPEILRRNNQNVRVRIQWPGYKEFHYEFRILDRKLGEHVPISMFRVVERVARGIHRLYLEGERDPRTFSERWKLGDDDGIDLNEVNIIGLLHISRGTWMPILQLNRHIIPRCDYFGGEEKEEVVMEEEESLEDQASREGASARSRHSSLSSAIDDDPPMLTTRKQEKKKTRKARCHPVQQQQ